MFALNVLNTKGWVKSFKANIHGGTVPLAFSTFADQLGVAWRINITFASLRVSRETILCAIKFYLFFGMRYRILYALSDEVFMDKKFMFKAIFLNVLWVLWIVVSVGLGYVIYKYAFPSQPVVIIPFSLLFLAVGGAVVFIINMLLRKRAAVATELTKDISENSARPTVTSDCGSSDLQPPADGESVSDGEGKEVEFKDGLE